jgi:hypothetical protein
VLLHNGFDVVEIDVYQTQAYEQIGDECQLLDVVDISVQAERQEYNHLHEDNPVNSNRRTTLADSKYESLQVLGNKNDIGAGEPYLADDERKIDEISESVAKNVSTHVAEGEVDL